MTVHVARRADQLQKGDRLAGPGFDASVSVTQVTKALTAVTVKTGDGKKYVLAPADLIVVLRPPG